MSRNRKSSFRITDDSFDISKRRGSNENNGRKRKSQKVSHVKEKQTKLSDTKNQTHKEDIKNISDEDSRNSDGLHHILKDHNNPVESHFTRKKKHVKFDEKNIKQTKPDSENDKIESEDIPADSAGKKIESVVRKLKSRPSKQRISEDTVVEYENKIEVASSSEEIITNGKEKFQKNLQIGTRNRKNRATKCISKDGAQKTEFTDIQKLSLYDCEGRNKVHTENTNSCKIKKISTKKPKKNSGRSFNAKGTRTRSVLEEGVKNEIGNISRSEKICTINNSSKMCTQESFPVTQNATSEFAVQNKENAKGCEEASSNICQSTLNENFSNKKLLTEEDITHSHGTSTIQVLDRENVDENEEKNINTTSERNVNESKRLDEKNLQDSQNTEANVPVNCAISENNEISEKFYKIIEESEKNSRILFHNRQPTQNIVLSEPKGSCIEMCNPITELLFLKAADEEVTDIKNQISNNRWMNNAENNDCDGINQDQITNVLENDKHFEQNVDKSINLCYENEMCYEDVLPSSAFTDINDCKSNAKSNENFLEGKEEIDVPPVKNALPPSECDKNAEDLLSASGMTSLDTNEIRRREIREHCGDTVKYQTENQDRHTCITVLSPLAKGCTVPDVETKQNSSNEDCRWGENSLAPCTSEDPSIVYSKCDDSQDCDTGCILSTLVDARGLPVGADDKSAVPNVQVKEEGPPPGDNEVSYVCEECEFETKIVTDFSYHYTLSHGQKHRQEIEDSACRAQTVEQEEQEEDGEEPPPPPPGLGHGEVLTVFLRREGAAGCDPSHVAAATAMTVQPALKTRERKSRRLLVYDDSSGEELKMYQCGLCDFKTRFGKNLEVHYRLTHGLLLELYECSHPECHFVTFLRDSLFHHYRTQHVEVGVLVRQLQASPPGAGK